MCACNIETICTTEVNPKRVGGGSSDVWRTIASISAAGARDRPAPSL